MCKLFTFFPPRISKMEQLQTNVNKQQRKQQVELNICAADIWHEKIVYIHLLWKMTLEYYNYDDYLFVWRVFFLISSFVFVYTGVSVHLNFLRNKFEFFSYILIQHLVLGMMMPDEEISLKLVLRVYVHWCWLTKVPEHHL